MTALQGRTVVVTRARGRQAELANLLTARGAIPVLFPTIETVPLSDPTELDRVLDGLPAFDWVVFTSASAVGPVRERLRARGWARMPAGVQVAAVGPATAEALAHAGVGVAVVPERYQGSAIPFALGDLKGRRVLVPRSEIGREETLSALRAAGATVEEVTVYRTIPAQPDPAAVAALARGVDVVTFTSPSTFRNFLALAGRDGPGLLARCLVACMGPSTAAAVYEFGLPRPLLSPEATLPSLVAAIEEHFTATPAERPR